MVCIIILFYVVVKPDSVERLSQQAATGPSLEYLELKKMAVKLDLADSPRSSLPVLSYH